MADNTETSAVIPEVVANEPASRGRGRPWQPGQSGNAGGKPAKTDEYRAFVDQCRKFSPEALGTLREIVRRPGGKMSETVGAIKLLLAYAWGQPTQAIEMSGKIETEITVIVKGKQPNVP